MLHLAFTTLSNSIPYPGLIQFDPNFSGSGGSNADPYYLPYFSTTLGSNVAVTSMNVISRKYFLQMTVINTATQASCTPTAPLNGIVGDGSYSSCAATNNFLNSGSTCTQSW
jgi:hypothetical protein